MRDLFWVGSSRDDLRSLPEPVKDAVGFALRAAQRGIKPPNAKPLVGFDGAGVLEIFEDLDGSTYRAIYSVKLKHGIYVLHVFQKKSTAGIKTPKREIDMIRLRMKTAEDDDRQRDESS